MKSRRNQIRGLGPDALFSGRRCNGRRGCNSSLLYYSSENCFQEALDISSKAHPANRPLHKLLSYAPSRRHSRNEHVQNGICAEFDNVGIVRLDDPVKRKVRSS
jgi:hypothetical protein